VHKALRVILVFRDQLDLKAHKASPELKDLLVPRVTPELKDLPDLPVLVERRFPFA
jgi:hypothetical protein